MKTKIFQSSKKPEIGSQEWFKKRAIEVIEFSKEGEYWDYSDSLITYSPQVIKEYQRAQEIYKKYGEIVTNEEHKFIKSISHDVINELPSEFIYIDLGPGTEHKEKYFFDEIKQQGKDIIYRPVDINKMMLKEAISFAESEGFIVNPIHDSFDKVYKYVQGENRYKFISLGLTFINYKIEDISSILKRIVSSNGSTFITAQIRERIDIETVKQAYAEIGGFSKKLFDIKMSLVGVSPSDYIYEVDDRIRAWCTIKNPSDLLISKGVKPGDRFLLFRSIRYSENELRELLKKEFDVKYFDKKDNSFIGCLLRNRL